MQQPGLQQIPAGWPGMPGLQAPLSAQASPFAPSPPQPFPSGQSPFPAPPASSPQPLLAQPPAQPFPGQSYTIFPQSVGPQPFPMPTQGLPNYHPPFPPQAQAQAPFPPQVQTQYQAQAQAAPQPQALPVSPVAFPSSPYGSAQPQGQQAPPNPAQALARQLIEMAKALEQLIPGYQTVLSLLLELTSTSPSPGLADAVRGLQNCLYYHGATLGAARRLLCGEATPAVLTNLATAFHGLQHLQPKTRAAAERVLSLAPSAQRGPAAGLVQTLSAAEAALDQVGASMQAFVGPQIWEATRNQVRERLGEATK